MYKKILMFLLVIISNQSLSIESKRQYALITGVSRGIGYALAQNLLNRGMYVIGISRSDSSILQELLKNSHFSYISCDITTTTEGLGAIKQHIKNNNILLNFIINNAGMMNNPKTLDAMDFEEIEKVLQINLIAPMKLSALLIPYCTSHARILNITSRAATTVVPYVAPYCISKAGLNMLTNILKKEVEHKKIAVASVIPGEVDTAIQSKLRDSSPEFPLKEKFQENYVNGSLITSQMCADFLSWLLCEISFNEFNSKELPWEIYDISHHEYWLKGFLPPFPF